ncbi:hypothetical protein [Agrobacterium genomosp. 2]|uniref:Uncharacterized protein n=1 Tax=Agrobacterium genomosp. 2 str. CFBP 5494 TaxID=1183436 RepID=A0A9W5AYT8_9HYPH|nr:hypothetical protein [Agrobacterium genomosp. 2]CUW87482.1 hypothetical protein AGR2A_Cc120065 [Agrobacterium genomosp. 2 str. CFBP 5494]
MANTIDTAVSSLGDAFECAVLDSNAVSVGALNPADLEAWAHRLGNRTTLVTLYVSATVEVVRAATADGWTDNASWPLLGPGYHPFNVPGGNRYLLFKLPSGAAAPAVVKILEN